MMMMIMIPAPRLPLPSTGLNLPERRLGPLPRHRQCPGQSRSVSPQQKIAQFGFDGFAQRLCAVVLPLVLVLVRVSVLASTLALVLVLALALVPMPTALA